MSGSFGKGLSDGSISLYGCQSSNSAMMDWNGPNFSFGSIANGLFHIN